MLVVSRPHHSHPCLHPLQICCPQLLRRLLRLQLTELLMTSMLTSLTYWIPTLSSTGIWLSDRRIRVVQTIFPGDGISCDTGTQVTVEQWSRVGCLDLLNTNRDEEYKPVSFILLLYMCVLCKQWILSIDLKARAITTCELLLRLAPVGACFCDVRVPYIMHCHCGMVSGPTEKVMGLHSLAVSQIYSRATESWPLQLAGTLTVIWQTYSKLGQICRKMV